MPTSQAFARSSCGGRTARWSRRSFARRWGSGRSSRRIVGRIIHIEQHRLSNLRHQILGVCCYGGKSGVCLTPTRLAVNVTGKKSLHVRVLRRVCEQFSVCVRICILLAQDFLTPQDIWRHTRGVFPKRLALFNQFHDGILGMEHFFVFVRHLATERNFTARQTRTSVSMQIWHGGTPTDNI